MRLRRWVGTTGIVLLAIVCLLLFVAGPLLLSAAVVNRRFQFPDPLLGKTPGDFAIPYDEISFAGAGSPTLRGWYIPGQPGRATVIFSHGLNRSRVEMLPQAQFVHSLGLSALLFDLRHHGKSGGDKTTLGAREKDDVLAAIDWVKAKQPDSHIVLWGISMGAASAMLAAAQNPSTDAVICDSSYLSFSDTINHHFRLFFRLPPWPIATETAMLLQWRGGFKADEIDIAEATRRMANRPVLFVGQSGDRRVPAEVARRLFEISTSPNKRLLIFSGRRHGHAYGDHVEQYQEAVREFLSVAEILSH